MATTIQLRRGSASAWAAANPVLRAGEPGIALDTKLLKIGDGVTPWASLVGVVEGLVLTSDARLSDARVPVAHTQAFSTLTGVPSTLAGYGIPAITKSDVGLSLVENTALSTWGGSANLVTLGTLANLTVTNPIVGSVTGAAGSTSGNAATATLAAAATVLQTARLINGVSFDGSGNITIPAAAATLTGTALPAAIVSSSLTSVGTLAALTVTAPIVGSVTGNAATATLAAAATILQTARTINGVSFNGAANIAVPASLLHVSTTSAATPASLVETDLWTYTLPSNTLDVDGKGIRLQAFLTLAANTNSKVVKVYLNGILLHTVTSTISGARVFLDTVLIRTGAAAETGWALATVGAAVVAPSWILETANTAAPLILKITGTNGVATANDIVFRSALVEWRTP